MAIKNRVILAAGHGGGDNGAVGQGTTEANETIQITNRVADILRNSGKVEVVVVPHELNLGATIDWINARYKGLEDGLSIEIHKNSGGGTGSEVWAPSYPDATSKANAAKIADALAAATGLRNRGVKEAQNNRWGRLGFTDDTNTYALLVEAGFIDVDSNDDNADAAFAKGIAQGVLNILGNGATAPAPTQAPSNPQPAKASNETVAQQIIDGVGGWGNGDDRKNNLSAKGYDYATIQSIVNRKLGYGTQTVSSGVSLSAVVDKVLNGDYGNNPGRADKLRAEGYDPNTVQAAVNARLGVAGAAPVNQEIVKGSKVQVTNPVDVNGTRLGVSGTYDVMEVNGDRVVIGRGGAVTAAIRRQNLKRV
jgi:hypothetical protein